MTSRRGTATVEFALLAPLILLLVAGVLNYTMLMCTAIAVADAARAGAQFGSLSTTNASNIAGIQTAAANAAPGISGLTATAAKVCQCSDGSSVSCGSGSCSSGTVRTYVQVTVQANVGPIFNYSQLPFGGGVTATASMRAQ